MTKPVISPVYWFPVPDTAVINIISALGWTTVTIIHDPGTIFVHSLSTGNTCLICIAKVVHAMLNAPTDFLLTNANVMSMHVMLV